MDQENASRFRPFHDLAARLLPYFEGNGDGAHDIDHLVRVWHNARQIQAHEGGDPELLAAAILLHDCVSVPKNAPDRHLASRLPAEQAATALARLDWAPARVETVADAIASHSYSAGIEPNSVKGRILQDADRLDAIGFVGIARCFYTAGRMGSLLYHPSDPKAGDREFNDGKFALDHFPQKLLRLAEGFKTDTGQNLARERHQACLAVLSRYAGRGVLSG
ncbi:MAG: HD domain-containing protein [Bryobacteraceae bacterium]